MDSKPAQEVEEVGAEEEEGQNADEYLNTQSPEEEENVPPEVQRRIKALKNIQLNVTKLETQFYEEMHALECKYLPLYQPLFEKRRQITIGEYEPNDEECDFALNDPDEVANAIANVKLTESEEEPKEKVNGIPDFWLKIFKNVEMLEDLVEHYDEPILKHLSDVTIEMSAKPMGFKLHFHFTPNEFFTNPVLTKSYAMKCEMESEDPFSFEGPEIVSSSGCHIDWIKGKNVTVKTIRKKQKHKQRGSVRTICKTVEAESFFNFFNPPQVPEDGEAELDEQTQIRLTTDFEIGQYIRERIVPHAVLYYTGEALDDEYEVDDEDEDEDVDEEDDDEEGEADPTPREKRSLHSRMAVKSGQQDCNQQ